MNINFEYWILQTLAMMLTALLLPGFSVKGPIPALIAVVSFGFVNAHLWDAALFFQIPSSLTTQALTLIVANGIIFWLVVKLLPGIDISGVFPAIAAPLVFTLISFFLLQYQEQINWPAILNEISNLFNQAKSYVTKPVPAG